MPTKAATNWRKMSRAWQVLIDRHNAGELTFEQYKAKMKPLSILRNAAMEKRRKELKPDEMGRYPVLGEEKELGRVDVSFDAEIRSVI